MEIAIFADFAYAAIDVTTGAPVYGTLRLGTHPLTETDQEQVWFERGDPAGTRYQNNQSQALGDPYSDIPLWISGVGTVNNTRPGPSANGTFFQESQDPLVVGPNDVFFCWVTIPATKAPSEVMIQLFGGDSWEHRAYWGANTIPFGVNGTDSRRYIGTLPSPGRYKFEFPLSQVGLGSTVRQIDGFSVAIPSGDVQVSYDRTGIYTPGNVCYDPRIEALPTIERSTINGSRVGGRAVESWGDLVVLGSVLDLVPGIEPATFTLSGRRVRLRIGVGSSAAGWAIQDFWTGQAASVSYEPGRIRIGLREAQSRMDLKLNPFTYGGTNATTGAEDGVDGSVEQKGKPKPVRIGRARNAEPVLVNRLKLIYEVHDDAGTKGVIDESGLAIGSVREGAATVTYGGEYSNAADMQTTAPAVGTFKRWNNYVRLGSVPSRPITIEKAPALALSFPNFLKAVLVQSGVAADALLDGDLTALNTPEAGGFWSGDVAAYSAVDEALASWALVTWVSRAGRYRIKQAAMPNGTPSFSLTASDVWNVSIDPAGEPVNEVIVNYAPNYRPLTETEVAAGVAADVRQDAMLDKFTAKAADAFVKRFEPSSTSLEVDTLLRTHADTLASHLLGLYATRRYIVTLTVDLVAAMKAGHYASMTPQTLVGLDPDLCLISQGRIVAVAETVGDNSITLKIWG